MVGFGATYERSFGPEEGDDHELNAVHDAKHNVLHEGRVKVPVHELRDRRGGLLAFHLESSKTGKEEEEGEGEQSGLGQGEGQVGVDGRDDGENEWNRNQRGEYRRV